MRISSGTDVGMLRQSNQDYYSVGELPFGGYFAVVCDGMGGHAGGNVASKLAAERIEAQLKKNFRENMSVSSIKNMTESAFVLANLDVYDAANENEELAGMGTTAVAAVFFGNDCIIANVGDSRCYLIGNEKITQLTRDHSWVQSMVDAGYITEQEAEHHPRKNLITRALGIDENVEPDIFEISFNDGDRLLLCSDGLTNMLSNDEILEVINTSDFDDNAQKLIDIANKNGGKDNITVVVAEK